MSQEELRLSQCEGKVGLTASVAKRLKVKHQKRGRRSTAYKCPFCKQWHIGDDSILKGGHRA